MKSLGPSGVIGVWEFDENEKFDPVVAMDRIQPPSWNAREVTSRGDVVTLQLETGARPSIMPSTRYYIEKRGPFRMLRHEVWPGDGAARVMLTMRAWPQRGVD